MTITTLDVPSLKTVKNAVIGNRTAKASYGRDHVFISGLVECINDPPVPDGLYTTAAAIRVEAAHIIASLSYGSSDALKTLLELNALQALLYAVSMFQPTDPKPMKAALTRALRALTTAVAETVGPSQWGLPPAASDLRREAKAALDYAFQPEVLDVYIPLLLDPAPQVNIAVAQLLAYAVRDSAHRAVVSEWCPPAERKSEAKGKRGWEKREATRSPSRHGGWIARTLTALLHRKDMKLQEAALSALASLTKDNEMLALRFARSPPDQEPVLSTILSLSKSRNTDLQLAASLCATNILRASAPSNIIYVSPADRTTAITIMHVLNRVISSQTASYQARTKACFTLYYLVTDHRAFCQLAFERNSLVELAHLITSIMPPEKTTEFEEDEPESTSRLREAALTAVAAISLFDDDIRTEVTDELRLVPALLASLAHPSVGVRYAACQCARALSRAVSALRTNIVDTGLGMAVFQLFLKLDEDRQVTCAALTVVCNIVTDFSPLRVTILEQGLIPRLVQLLNSETPELRLNTMWAFKNLLYRAEPELKRQVMSSIGWTNMITLLEDENSRIREQSLHVLRHVADGIEDVEILLSEMGGSQPLLDILASAMMSGDDDVVMQAVFVLANVANNATYQRAILADARILSHLRGCLVDAKVEIRRPAVSCVFELASTNPHAHRELHAAGIESTLRHMCQHGSHHHHTHAVAASPTAGLRLGGGGRAMGAEDDVEVQNKARNALRWLEQSAEMDA